ncbi:MAG: CDP-glycerol--glycerophosphate glycerophosphotransferase [Acholeplasmataceae bacterium]|nr:CDP-glycerol--glycerophosphate glycerophosphotransferase [Acholeplasmataceae bacterium]
MILYIDPGTGSMLFSIVIGLATALYFVGKAAIIKLKVFFTGGKAIASKNHVPLVIYSEGTRYWNVFKPVLDELDKRSFSTIFYTSSEDDPVFEQNYQFITSEFIGQGNKAFARLNFLEADLCLMTTPGLDVLQLKRSKGVKHYSHILHAVTDASMYRLFGLDYFDSILLTGEYHETLLRKLEKQRNLPAKEMPVVGCTYLDVFNEKLKGLSMPENRPFTVLVSPSWGTSGILSRYGATLLDPLLGTGCSVIIRPHPQSRQAERQMLDALRERYQNERNIEWDEGEENIGTLARADVMISDFSGIIFDYAFLFDRPVLYITSDFDHRPYDSYELEEEQWVFRTLPKIGYELKPQDFKNIGKIIGQASENEELSRNRAQAKGESWQYIGESGKRVVDYLLSKIESLKEQ